MKTDLEAAKPMLEAYAAACGSEMAVIDYFLDPKGRHQFVAQKLLIPKAFSTYDIVVHMDLDVLIPKSLPNVFSCMPADAGLAAVVDPRGTEAYQAAWGFEKWTTMSHREHFNELGFTSQHELLCINAGVLIFRPRLVADLFEAWYMDESTPFDTIAAGYGIDEVPLAYLSQSNGLFAPLECRFNRQVNYALHETDEGRAAYEEYRLLVNRVRRRSRKIMGKPFQNVGWGQRYVRFIEDLLRAGNLVHFSGKFPIPAVDRRLLVGSE
jgi:hypothetical protein